MRLTRLLALLTSAVLPLGTAVPAVAAPAAPGQLKVMSVNLWYGGTKVNDYRAKQVRFLREQAVDVVAMQESYSVAAKELAAELGWHHYQASYSLGLISRYPITAKYAPTSATGKTLQGAGIRIRLPGGKETVVWSAHLNYTPYGPYDACHAGMTTAQILRREEESQRPQEIRDILAELREELADAQRTPVILAGDFNTPSHLDWTAATRKSHCGYTIDWPTTKEVAKAGLTDSYRAVHPDPARGPGNTWSPVYLWNDEAGKPEPQDRIDFIHVKGSLRVLDSRTVVVGTPKPVPHHRDNEWTSDHAAVVSTFRFTA
ncbi:endonuclease/exonuclease/phosphatase family protein [Crossiella sp. SN42]|uniref:endonuclease/exonuclease/phosphatase family protein n=1 Tax=Crossiella sp. SN42 TaxID=2944808 RepID=UPI00207CEB84|nr:endonuclease/exonuclease/phosphatase family protein [Crossiella sp. SN42]MCO1581744.1 endonuclease/exonuclease/phosphatase family protein [Crossiella sp. SN42]